MIDNTTFASYKAKYVTFGCKLNFAESSSIATNLEQKGVRRATDWEDPDVIIVNTCSVTAVADKKCRHMIRSLASRYPGAGIFVTGCYSQLKPDEARSLPGVVTVIGNDSKNTLPNVVEAYLNKKQIKADIIPAKDFSTFEHSCSRGDRTRYFLKVQDGCNYFCSYCTIPYARGKSRSPEISSLLKLAEKAAADGAKEIVLTGVNIGDFGRNSSEKFIDLIRTLENVDGIDRYRISSIEPNLLTEEIIKFVASSKRFMPHFHIPLQSGNDEVLKLMRRHYDTKLFSEKIALIRQFIPDAFIGVDLIVGMRGETPERFESSVNFIQNLDISRLHVFPYSERPGTAALQIKHVVNPVEQRNRMNIILDLSKNKEKKFSERFIETIRPVLFEEFNEMTGMISGHTDNYLKVSIKPTKPSLVNEISPVFITGIEHCDKDGVTLKGNLVDG